MHARTSRDVQRNPREHYLIAGHDFIERFTTLSEYANDAPDLNLRAEARSGKESVGQAQLTMKRETTVYKPSYTRTAARSHHRPTSPTQKLERILVYKYNLGQQMRLQTTQMRFMGWERTSLYNKPSTDSC